MKKKKRRFNFIKIKTFALGNALFKEQNEPQNGRKYLQNRYPREDW